MYNYSITNKAFENFKHIQYEFPINLSIDEILNQKTVDFIIGNLENMVLHAEQFLRFLKLKIENYNKLRKFITKIKIYGCQIAIDDFGSGYSIFSNI